MIVLLGDNEFVNCTTLVAIDGRPMLQVLSDPLEIVLRIPEGEHGVSIEPPSYNVVSSEVSYAVFRERRALAIATRLTEDEVHLYVDLRAVGVNLFSDAQGLRIAGNTFVGNRLEGFEIAVNLADPA